MPAHPGGIMLPKVYSRADVDRLDNYLSAFEAANGIDAGSTRVIVLVTETAEAMFHTCDYKGAPRVVALTLLGAATASVLAIETIQGDFRDLDGLKARAEKIRRDGYRGMLAIHPAQVDVINKAFAPTTEEIAEAQEVIAVFAANPGAGTIGYKGAMLDRPFLSRAQQLLKQAACA